MHSFYKMIYAI